MTNTHSQPWPSQSFNAMLARRLVAEFSWIKVKNTLPTRSLVMMHINTEKPNTCYSVLQFIELQIKNKIWERASYYDGLQSISSLANFGKSAELFNFPNLNIVTFKKHIPSKYSNDVYSLGSLKLPNLWLLYPRWDSIKIFHKNQMVEAVVVDET